MQAAGAASGSRVSPASETSLQAWGSSSRGYTSQRVSSRADYGVLDLVDFGAPAGIKGRPVAEPVANAGRLLFSRSTAVKSGRKRWQEDKVREAAAPSRSAEALVGILAARQPAVATIVGRAHEAKVVSEEGSSGRICRSFRRVQRSQSLK